MSCRSRTGGSPTTRLEPFYDRFEYLAGISGKAGNLNGVIQAGGNPFEGPRKREYPLPPMQMTYAPTLFAEAARSVGYHPFPSPSANLSADYTNPLGIRMGQCTFCGFCVGFGCANYSKASPQTSVLPVLMRKSNFEARTECEVLKVNLDRSGKRATGVTYIDSSGTEWEQPAELVLICAFAFNNVHMMLISGIGRPYDPKTREGTVGRNYAYQTYSSVQLFFDDKIFNPFIGSGALGQTVDDFNGDNFDHGGLDFVGGAAITCQPTNGRPLAHLPVPPGTPRWGARWKEEAKKNYLRSFGFASQGSQLRRLCQPSRSRSDLHGSFRQAASAHDVRFSRQRHSHVELRRRQDGADRQGDEPATICRQPPRQALQRGAGSEHAQYRRRDHGSRSQDQRGQQIPAELGRAECVRHRRLRLPAERRATIRTAPSARSPSSPPTRSSPNI